MEMLNLGDSIAHLKFLGWQYSDTVSPEARDELVERILETIDSLEIPELLGSEMGEL